MSLVLNCQKIKGFSLVEMLVVLIIISGLVVAAITTLSGLKSKEKVDIVAQSIMNDLIQIRSRALTTNQAYRMSFITTTSWRLQRNNSGTWIDDSDVRNMPADTFITSASLTNAGSNLEASARGLYGFVGAASGSPYVTISGVGVSQTRSIHVYIGGAIEKQTP